MPKCKWVLPDEWKTDTGGSISCDLDAAAMCNNEYCIFHAPLRYKDIESKRNIFREQLQTKIAAIESSDNVQLYDFNGYVFPENFKFFMHKEFRGPADFLACTFGNNSNLNGAEFNADVCFSGSLFNNGMKFVSSEFKGKAIFENTMFGDGTAFINSVFHSEANFEGSTFGSGTSFDHSMFWDPTSFVRNKFGDGTDFSWVHIQEKLDFTRTFFDGSINFFASALCGKADFTACTFMGSAKFEWPFYKSGEPADFKGFHDTADFTRCSFLEPEKVVFYKARLFKAIFSHVTDIEFIKFIDVDWGRYGKREHSIHEEELATSETFPVVAKTYRSLMKNYENAREFNLAGDFYIGAMEMEKRALWSQIKYFWKDCPRMTTFFRFVFHSMYGAVSWYGESYVKAMGWLLFSFFSWTVVYWTLTTEQILIDDLIQNSWPMKTIFMSFVESLRVVTFQRWSFPDDWKYSLVASFQTLTTVPLLALFLLALRRRFRR